jgi:hypothetical protein
MAALKYKTPQQVMLALLSGTKRRHFQELKTRHKRKGNVEYVKLLQEGIDMYDKYKVKEELRDIIDPEKEMSKQEWEDMVGLKG